MNSANGLTEVPEGARAVVDPGSKSPASAMYHAMYQTTGRTLIRGKRSGCVRNTTRI
jgi:hypothetical protein